MSVHTAQKCACATTTFITRANGIKVEKVTGRKNCPKCRGAGKVITCSVCEGAGMRNNQRCEVCQATGWMAIK